MFIKMNNEMSISKIISVWLAVVFSWTITLSNTKDIIAIIASLLAIAYTIFRWVTDIKKIKKGK